jgi:hypothetical protein
MQPPDNMVEIILQLIGFLPFHASIQLRNFLLVAIAGFDTRVRVTWQSQCKQQPTFDAHINRL